MKYEKPIMNISMFEAESIATDPTQTLSSITQTENINNAIAVAQTRNANVQRALVVIKFND